MVDRSYLILNTSHFTSESIVAPELAAFSLVLSNSFTLRAGEMPALRFDPGRRDARPEGYATDVKTRLAVCHSIENRSSELPCSSLAEVQRIYSLARLILTVLSIPFHGPIATGP